MTLIKIAISLGALTLISACANNPSFGPVGGNSSVNYAASSDLGAALPGREAAALQTAFVDAMDNGSAGQKTSWRGKDASGAVTPGALKVGNLRYDPKQLLDFRPGLKLSRQFETDLGEFVLTRNSNVRYGPSTDDKAVEILPSGTGVDVVGKVIGAPWMLVAVDDTVIGFVYEDLMVRRPGTELELAGGPTRTPLLCREFTQSLTYAGRTDRWSGAACKGDGGWTVLAPDENAPTRLY